MSMKLRKAFSDDGTREAAALQYEEGRDSAPRITALGRGYLAARMIREAEDGGVRVVRDKALSHTLHKLSVGDEIPEGLYRVVAEILAFVYMMDRKEGAGQRAGSENKRGR